MQSDAREARPLTSCTDALPHKRARVFSSVRWEFFQSDGAILARGPF